MIVEFCGVGCQSNCSPPGPQSCGADQASALQRRIGYYEVCSLLENPQQIHWSLLSIFQGMGSNTTMQFISPRTNFGRNINSWYVNVLHSLTCSQAKFAVNFAFALLSDTFQIIEMSPGDASLWSRTTALKKKNIALRVFLSIGGWSFNDPVCLNLNHIYFITIWFKNRQPTQHIFSQLVGSDANIQTFISSALQTLQAYGFDGIGTPSLRREHKFLTNPQTLTGSTLLLLIGAAPLPTKIDTQFLWAKLKRHSHPVDMDWRLPRHRVTGICNTSTSPLWCNQQIGLTSCMICLCYYIQLCWLHTLQDLWSSWDLGWRWSLHWYILSCRCCSSWSQLLLQEILSSPIQIWPRLNKRCNYSLM